jgi:hypothetical protein
MLQPGDPRHGYNGYTNLGCRCEICRLAGNEYHAKTYNKIDLGTGSLFVDAPRVLHSEFKAYAAVRGESMRSLALRAIRELMDREPVDA